MAKRTPRRMREHKLNFLTNDKMQGCMDMSKSTKYNESYNANQFVATLLLPNLVNEIRNTIGDTLFFSSNIVFQKIFLLVWD